MTSTTPLPALVAAARALVRPGERRVLGIAGAPGSGKSTLAERLGAVLGQDAVVVGLDGFHLAAAELHRLGRTERKGAPDTFDAAGYVNLLRRLRSGEDAVVYAPVFDRGLDEPVAGAVAVPATVPLVVTEGNYLLLDEPAWRPVHDLLDECWFLDPDEDERLERLVGRHVRYGRTPEQARQRSYGPDQRNAELVAATRSRADRVVRLPALPGDRP